MEADPESADDVVDDESTRDARDVQKEIAARDANENAGVESGAGPAGEDAFASIDRGAEIYRADCSSCHYDDSADSKIGPGLAGLFERDRIAASGKAMTPGNVREQIIDPAGSMPAFGGYLTDEQLDDLLSYLATL